MKRKKNARKNVASLTFTFAKQTNLLNSMQWSQLVRWCSTVFWNASVMLLLLLNVEQIIPFQKTNQGREMAQVETDDTR